MDEKPKRRPLPEDECPICGHSGYEWGKPGTQGGLYFVPLDGIYGFGMGEGLLARKCLACGNVQLFIKDYYASK